MISVEECREKLGRSVKDWSDEKVEQFRDDLYAMVEMILDEYIESCFDGTYDQKFGKNVEKGKDNQPVMGISSQ